MVGFIIIGVPNMIDSLILKMEVGKATLPIFFRCCDFALNAVKSTKAKVAPLPPQIYPIYIHPFRMRCRNPIGKRHHILRLHRICDRTHRHIHKHSTMESNDETDSTLETVATISSPLSVTTVVAVSNGISIKKLPNAINAPLIGFLSNDFAVK